MKRIRRIAITVLALMISASSVFAFVQEISLQSTVHRLQPGNVSSQTDQYAYMPYGVATHTGNSQTPYQWLGGFRLRYSTARQDGVYYDHTTDLHLTLHRAYSSDMRKFISPDPLGIDGGVNVYAYANLNPLFFVDPLGLCADVGEIRAPRYSSNRPFWLNLLTNPGETMMHNFVEHNGGIHNISDADWNRQYKLAEQSQMTTEIAIMTAMGTVSEVPAGAVARISNGQYNGVRKLSQVLRDAGVSRANRLDVINSFKEGTIIYRESSGGENFIRYFGGDASMRGRYLTPTFPQGNVRSTLSLPPNNTANELIQFHLRSGASYFEGTVSPNFGYPGGGTQIFVPNLNNLVSP